MIQKATAMNVRHNLGELLNGVQYRHDSILITKSGKPVAALVDMALFNKIRRMKKVFNRLSDELEQSYEGIDEASIEQDIAEAIKAVREK